MRRSLGLVVAIAVLGAGCSAPETISRGQGTEPSLTFVSPSRAKEMIASKQGNRSAIPRSESEEAKARRRQGGRQAVTTSPLQSDPWSGIYELQGDVKFSPSLPGSHFELPPRMDVRYSPNAKTLTLYAESETDSEKWYGVGMILHLSGIDGESFKRFSLITPNRDGGTVTFGFPLVNPVAWTSLRAGEVSKSKTKDGKYLLTVAQRAEADWLVEIEPIDSNDVEPWFTEGVFQLSASGSSQPWQQISIDFDMSNSQSTTSGQLTLVRKS